MADFSVNTYNPDVLNCLANLSNDEVFTPPELANKMLDTLPQEIFSDTKTTFFDPACKSGVFLREIAKRLLKARESEYMTEKDSYGRPVADTSKLQSILNHIYKNQLFGIAITEMTSLLSRRTVYCSKFPNSIYSIANFDNSEGNIRYKRTEHTWQKNNCAFCGANKAKYDRDKSLESHAYEFIHRVKPEEIFNMKFDVIIGNPPYQLSTAQKSAQAIPIYNHFVEQAKKLNPRYLTMIIPSRWLIGGMRLDDFRESMLSDKKIRVLHDFENASECFTGVEIKGGVCYFLWDRDNPGDCKIYEHNEGKIIESERPLLEKGMDVYIRKNEITSMFRKVQARKEPSFADICSPMKPFGLPTSFKEYTSYTPTAVKVFANRKQGYIERAIITKNDSWINKWKLFVPKAIGIGNVRVDWIKPIIAEPGTCCTETYIVIGPFESKNEAENVYSYTQTRFFHVMLSLRKITQDTLQKTYSSIPMQDFSQAWTDEKLFKKYNLSVEEIDRIQKLVRPADGNLFGSDGGKR